MPFVKVVKNNAYFKRFQVKYRRRREGKTDYRARRQMILQDKTKYDAPKYRMVVRRTNTDIVAQIVHAKVKGDDVFCAAYSHELPKYGITHGLTNYAACYATGLLLARRTLEKVGLAAKFEGAKTADGTYKAVRTKKDDQGQEGRFPFKAILDVGLARTTRGARIFGCMKGAVDGGLAVPHNERRFPGYNAKKSEYNAKIHRARIFGVHVAEYYKQVKAQKDAYPDRKINQFKQFIAKGIKPEDIEKMYTKAHAAIRANPKADKKKNDKKKVDYRKSTKKSRKQRRETAKAKVAALRKKMNK
jgi:large subunit ribosomal protein L5e